MQKRCGAVVYSPSDLIRYFASTFASWMDRHHLENPDGFTLALTPKPYYAIQLCCYAEMLATVTGEPMSEKFGIILGRKDRVEFRVEDFIHYYRCIKRSFLALQDGYTGNMVDRQEPLPRAEHGRWSSLAEKFFSETDHLVQVAGISVGQIKKLKAAGITTVGALAAASNYDP